MFCERQAAKLFTRLPVFPLARRLMKDRLTLGTLTRSVRSKWNPYTEGNMADEKNKDQNQGTERNEKAMGATATSGTQGQQPDQRGQSGQQGQTRQGQSGHFGRSQQESAGQGGGIQGQRQRNPIQG